MAKPAVILLDEMMTGLAPKIVSSLADTVAELAADGTVVLVADPSLAAVGRIVDRGYVLVRGAVVNESSDVNSLERAYQKAMGIIHEEIEAEVEATS